MKTTPALLAAVLAGLTLAACATSSGQPRPAAATAAPAARPEIARPGATGSLAAARRALDQAIESMRTATVGNKGGFVERARADLVEARLNVTNCLAFIAAHPGIETQPPAPSAEISAISTRVSDFNVTSRPNHAPNLRFALSSVQTALVYLQQTPAGDRGGFRDHAIASLGQAVSDLIAGISQVDSPDRPARGARTVVQPEATLYRGMLGSYGSNEFPFYFLSVPDGSNIWGEAVKTSLNGKWDMARTPQQFTASGSFYLASPAKVKVEAGRAVTVTIDRLQYDLSNYGKWNGIETELAAGRHTLTLSVGNNGGQLAECGVKITALPGETEVPIFVTAGEVDDFVRGLPKGSRELSAWDAQQSKLAFKVAL